MRKQRKRQILKFQILFSIMRKFCFLCGKTTDKLVKGYCEECYIKDKGLAKIEKKIEIVSCPKCSLAKIRMKWKKLDIEKVLKSKIKSKSEIKDVSVKVKERTLRDINNIYEVTVRGYLPGSRALKTEKHIVKVHLNKRLCEACSKRLSGYYEASIQLRFNDMEGRRKEERIMNFILKELEIIRANDPMAFCRVEKAGKYFDVLVGSKRAAEKTALLVKRKFGAKMKKSYKLVTQREGKDVYRNVYSVRV